MKGLFPSLLAFALGCASAPPVSKVQAGSESAAPAKRVELVGRWHGAIEARGRKILLDLDFQPEGKGTLGVPQQGLRGLPLLDVRFDGKTLAFDSELAGGLRVSFRGEGTLERISGSYTQGGATSPFTLQRGARSSARTYLQNERFTEQPVEFVNGALKLAGTLTLPRAVRRPPVAVMITGSGPQDRDEEVFGFKVFEALAHALAEGGVATLRYDDRGVGDSSGVFHEATTADFATDVEAAVRFLRERPDVDARRIGLLGHSEGGMIAPMVAQKVPNLAFVVLLAAPAQKLDALLLEQIARVGKAEGKPSEAVALEQRITAQAVALLKEGKDLTGMGESLLSECNERCQANKAAALQAARASMESKWFRYFVAYDPVPPLRALQVATLALFGGLDVQVPADINRPLLEKALAQGKNPRRSVETLGDMNHVLQVARTGAVSEYSQLEKKLHPSVGARIVAFIQAESK